MRCGMNAVGTVAAGSGFAFSPSAGFGADVWAASAESLSARSGLIVGMGACGVAGCVRTLLPNPAIGPAKGTTARAWFGTLGKVPMPPNGNFAGCCRTGAAAAGNTVFAATG